MHLQVDLKSRADSLTIGELARRTNRRASAIRYYEEVGLLAAPERVSGQRRYPEETIRTLAVIDTAQRAGLTLAEIRPLLDGGSVDELRRIAERRIPEIDALLERASVVRGWLEAASRCECPSLDDCCLFDEPELPARESPRSSAD